MDFIDRVKSGYETITGGPKTTTTTTVEKPSSEGSTNWAAIIGGTVLVLGAVFGIYWFFIRKPAQKPA